MHRNRHDPLKNYVGFTVGEVHYAVPIARVREIANPLPIVAVPQIPPAILGVANYRGEVVPVVDLRIRFGLSGTASTRRTKWLVVDLPNRFVAMVVDSVTEVFGTGGALPAPAPTLGGDEKARGIAGVIHYREQLVFLLEVNHLRELTEPLRAAGMLNPTGQVSASLPPAALP